MPVSNRTDNFCSVPQAVLTEAASSLCRWPTGHVITWRVDKKLNAFSDIEYLDLCELAWALWEAKTGLRLQYDPGNSRANIILTTRIIDGPQGTLAEAQLPCGNITARSQLFMWADESEHWVVSDNPAGRMINAFPVFGHEFGHLIGISHITSGPALMNPTLSRIVTLQALDIVAGVDRYGDPSTTPGADGASACEELLKLFLVTPEARSSWIKGWELLKRAKQQSNEAEKD